MNKYAAIAAGLALIMASCGNDKTRDINIVGEWSIKAYNPIEMSSYTLVETDGDYRFRFEENGSFYCGTDCNSISGVYTIKGDSLNFNNMMSTRMACENEVLEHALQQALPSVRTIGLSEDSVLSMKESGGNTVVRLIKIK